MTAVTTSDGVVLHAESTGNGLPVLFLHELLADHRSWAAQVGALSGEFRCVTYSARGYPPSDVPSDPAAYSDVRAVEDAVDVLDALGIERAHVVGLSMGGFSALQLGVRHPDRVASLLVASAGSGAEPSGRAGFFAETEAIAEEFRRDGAAVVAGRLSAVPSRVQLRRKDRAAWDEFVTRLGEHSPEGMAFTVLGVQRSRPSLYDLSDDLARITTPTLVVNGDEDELSLRSGLMLKHTIPSAGLLVMPNCGHVLNLEEPALFNDVVHSFLHTVEDGAWPTRDPRALGIHEG